MQKVCRLLVGHPGIEVSMAHHPMQQPLVGPIPECVVDRPAQELADRLRASHRVASARQWAASELIGAVEVA